MKKKIVILGAGIGGLATAYYLSRTGLFDITVLEKSAAIGGLCGSFDHNGYTLDYGAHKLYSVMPDILDDITHLMGDRIIRIEKKNRLFLKDHLLDYPLRLGNLAKSLGLGSFFQLGSGYALSFLQNMLSGKEPDSYEEYIISRFGRPAYGLVFESLADKVWGDPSTLSPEMARTRVPASGGLEVILKLLGIKKETAETSADYFYYPRKGFGDFPLALRERIEAQGGSVRTSVALDEICRENGTISSVSFRDQNERNRLPCDFLISSIPLTELGGLVFRNSDAEFKQAVFGLQFRHLVLVYLFVNRPLLLKDQWIFFPEKKFAFSRIFEQKQMNPDLCPAESTAICCDFTCSGNSPQWTASDDALAGMCANGLIQSRFAKASEIKGHRVRRMDHFYPRYDLDFDNRLRTVLDKFKQVGNLLLTGRIGMYNYNNVDHCMDMGKVISKRLAENISCPQIIDELALRVKQYRIVD